MENVRYYPSFGTFFGDPYTPVERIEHEITPSENLRRYLTGQDYAWVPDILSDLVDLTPDCYPDVVANGYAGGLDAFGVEWIPNPSNPMLPAFVKPGLITLEDITEWESLELPDPDTWDWAGCAAGYKHAYGDDDRMFRGTVLCCYYERLIDLMGFEEAAMAMLEEPEAVEAFFDKLTEININIIDHYIDDFGCEMICVQDDWSSQQAPFFSPDIVEELLVPQIRKLADHAHERGCLFSQHSCGNGTLLVPQYKSAGIDTWAAQMTAIDLDAAYETAGDDFMLEIYPDVPEGLAGEALDSWIRGFMEKMCVKHRSIIQFYNFDMDRQVEVRRALYRIGKDMKENGCAA